MVLEEVLDGPDENESTSDWLRGGASTTFAVWDGTTDRTQWWFTSQFGYGPDGPTAASEATNVTTYYNSNSEVLERYINARNDLSSNQTVAVTWHIGNETEQRYIVATVDETTGNVTSSEMVAATDTEADHALDLCGYAAEQSREELERFVEEFAEPGKDVGTSYMAEQKGRYQQDVETTLFPSGGECGGAS